MKHRSMGTPTSQAAELRANRLGRSCPKPRTGPAVATVQGVTYVNDGSSISLEDAWATIREADRPVVWITMAGQNEVFAKQPLDHQLQYLIRVGDPPQAEDRENVYHLNDLRVAVFLARELAMEGSLVLYNPAEVLDDADGSAREFEQAVADL